MMARTLLVLTALSLSSAMAFAQAKKGDHPPAECKPIEDACKQAVFELAFASHAGMTENEFDAIAQAWFAKAKHPKFGRGKVGST